MNTASVSYSNGAVVNFAESVHDPEWAMYRVKHDFEITGGFKIEPQRHVGLNEQWQRFWMSLNMNPTKRTDKYGNIVTPENAFAAYTGRAVAFTDRYYSDDYADYINGHNLDQAPIAIEYIICGGAMVMCKPRDDRTMWIQYLDVFSPPPFGITWHSHPHLIYHATNTVNGQYANPFVNFGGRQSDGIVPVYVPLIAMSNNPPYLSKSLLAPVAPDDNGTAVVNGRRYALHNPYYPVGKIVTAP